MTLTPEKIAEIVARYSPDNPKLVLYEQYEADIAALLSHIAAQDKLIAELRALHGWRTDWENAPKDGTKMDFWYGDAANPYRVADVFWGSPIHECGENGRLCDSCPDRDGWCDVFGYLEGDDGHEIGIPTHYCLITPPDKDSGR